MCTYRYQAQAQNVDLVEEVRLRDRTQEVSIENAQKGEAVGFDKD